MSERLHTHSLLHSAASNMVTNNVSLYTIIEILGIVDYSTVQISAHFNRENLIGPVGTPDKKAVTY